MKALIHAKRAVACTMFRLPERTRHKAPNIRIISGRRNASKADHCRLICFRMCSRALRFSIERPGGLDCLASLTTRTELRKK